MIDTIIFDIGNVLAMADWNSTFAEIGIAADRIPAVKEATVKSVYWHEFDRGVMSDEDILNLCIGLAPDYEDDIRLVFANPDKYVKVTDYASEWIRSYHDKGFHTYILSNFPRVAFESSMKNFTFLNEVDGAVISYREGKIKPEKAIYDCLVTRYGVVPANSIFVDDLKVNVEAAISYGYNGVIFTGREAADKEIEKICQNQQNRN